MKPKIKTMNWMVKLLSFNFASSIVLAPFGIYIDDKNIENDIVINHCKIHWEQQIEMLLIFKFLWQFIEWLAKLPTNLSDINAYLDVSFEREAFANENNLEYLKTRKPYSWINYI
jgi:hypothetical protein